MKRPEPRAAAVAVAGLPAGPRAGTPGNGLGVFARWLVDHRHASRDHVISVPAGPARCRVHPSGDVTVAMGRASFDARAVPVARPLRATPVSIAGQELPRTARQSNLGYSMGRRPEWPRSDKRLVRHLMSADRVNLGGLKRIT